MKHSLRVRVVVAAAIAAFSLSASAGPGGGGGNVNSVLLTADGQVWTAGLNYNGEVGDDTAQPRLTRVSVLTGATSVDAGTNHTVAVVGGSVYGWGHGGFGQQCNDQQFGYSVPTLMPTVTGVTQVSTSTGSTFLLKADGTLLGCGSNVDGVLGDGTTTMRKTPVAVSGVTDAIAVSAGLTHALALRANGTVVAWGNNQFGKIGDGTTTTRLTPVPVSGLSNITAIAAGGSHNLALDASGHVWAWGSGFSGAIGDNGSADRLTPVQVPNLANVTAIAAGSEFSVALTSTSEVWVWGLNSSGQLGLGDQQVRRVPTLVAGLTPISAIAVGQAQTYAFASDGGIYGWGDAPLGDGTLEPRSSPNVLAEAGGVWRTGTPRFSLSPATVYATEQTTFITSASSGATVRYTTTGLDPTESDLVVPAGGIAIDQNRTLKARAWKAGHAPSAVASATYTLRPMPPTVTPGGGAYTSPRTVTLATPTSGAEIRYTLDNSEPTASSALYAAALPIATATTLKAKAFKAGWDQSSTATAGYTFNYGTLETPVATPGGGTYPTDQTITLTVPNAPAGTALRYTLDGSTPGTGSALYTGPLTIGSGLTLKARAFHPDWTQSAVASASYAFVVATPTFTLASGTHPAGQVIAIATATPNAVIRYTLNGTAPTTTDPILEPGATLTVGDYTLKAAAWRAGYSPSGVATATYQIGGDFTAARIAAGATHTLALKRDGTVWATGYNGWGQLGDLSMSQRNAPVVVAGLTGMKAIAAGTNHSVAAGLDGRVYTWGSNSSRQLGDGSTVTHRTSFTVVPGLNNIVAVAAGNGHTLALASTGEVYGWGGNSSGQVGNGTQTQANLPVLIAGLSNIVGIAAGDAHSLAWTTSGALYAWGANNQGQLGDGSQTMRTSPVLIAGVTGVVEAAGGTGHSLARTISGDVRAWGRNWEGQLGIGATPLQVLVPTAIALLSNVQAIGAGTNHSLASTTAATYAWGTNPNKQLVDTTTNPVNAPTVLSAIPPFINLAGGSGHSIGLDATGAVWSWGSASLGQLGNGATTLQSAPSPISGSGQTWGAAAPTASLAPGLYPAEQSVTLTSATPGATIRYTVNGNDPTTADPIASGPIAIAQSTTLKARAWKGSLAPSAVATFAYELQAPLPTATPAGGVYPTPGPDVTLTSAVGGTIRYTLDGSEPSATSAAFASPIHISTLTTLKARTFKAGWTPSAVRTESYVIGQDTVAPTITARVVPALNAQGWAMTPAAVVFICRDAESPFVSCPASVSIPDETDTNGLTFTGTTMDLAGHTASASATVKVDLTPPEISLTSPADGVLVTASTIALSGTVSDALSGVAAVRCNDVAATVSNGIVTCEVPLRPGRNPIVLSVRDVAGHSRSVGITVHRVGPPSHLTLSPEQLTLLEGAEAPLHVVDNFGRVPTSLTFTVDEPTVVEVVESPQTMVRALAPGSATVTASVGSYSAQMAVTVVSGTIVLVPGTTRWVVQGAPGYTLDKVIYTNQTSPDVPEAVLVESIDGTQPVLRGVSDGVTTSITPVSGGAIGQTMGDSFGGVLLVQAAGDLRSTLQRVGFTPDVLPWRYVSEGAIENVVQLHDGTVFFSERHPNEEGGARAAAVVVLDGATGSVRARVPITAIVRDEVVQLDCFPGYNTLAEGVGLQQLYALSTDGRYAVVTTDSDNYLSTVTPEPGCFEHWGWRRGHEQLLIVDGTGASTTVPLTEWDETIHTGSASAAVPLASGLAADASGNFIVDQGGTPLVVGPGAGGPALPVGDGVIVSDSGHYVRREDTQIVARDSETGTMLWTAVAAGEPIGFSADGRPVALVMSDGVISEAGPSAQSGPVASLDATSPKQLAQLSVGRLTYSTGTTLVRSEGPNLLVPEIHGTAKNLQQQGSTRRRREFSSLDQAGIAALREYFPIGIERRREYAGSVCRQSGDRYIYTDGLTNLEGFSTEPIPSVCPSGTTHMGEYHNHTPCGNQAPSSQDLGRLREFNRTNPGARGYVGVPADPLPYAIRYYWENDEAPVMQSIEYLSWPQNRRVPCF